MALSALDDKAVEPIAGELAKVLGPSEDLWYDLISRMEASYGPLSEAWSFSGAKYGWSLRLKQKLTTKKSLKTWALWRSPEAGSLSISSKEKNPFIAFTNSVKS